MAFATPARTNGADFIDAIRSIALQELDGENISPRVQHLANMTGLGASTVLVQVAEMVDILAH
jgi:hypothetical protein